MDTIGSAARPLTVLVTSDLPARLRAEVASAAGRGARIDYETAAPAIVSRLPGTAVILAGAFTPSILAAWPAGAPRWLHTTGAGVERLLFPELVASDVLVTNSRGAHRVAMPEFVLMALLAWTHHLPALIRAQSRREWVSPVPDEIAGKTLGLLGYGEIGRAVAAKASAVGVRCLALRRHPGGVGEAGDAAVERVYGPAELAPFLGACDFVVNSLPLTAATRGLLDGKALRAMRPHAVLINLGRGPTVVEADLLSALREGRLGGAVLDVFDAEPLPPESPFWALDNVLITSHTSGNSVHYLERAVAIFCDNLRRFGAGEPLRNVVDKRLGY